MFDTNKVIKNIAGDIFSKNHVDLYCPNCGENLVKDTENPKHAYCSNCGKKNIKNERGY